MKHRRDLKSHSEHQVLFPFNVMFFLQTIDCRAFLKQDLLVLRWQDYLTFGKMPLSNMNVCVCVCAHVLSRIWLVCDPVDYSLPRYSVHGVLQVRTMVLVAISFSRGLSQPRDRTHVSCIGRRVLYHWATREALQTWMLLHFKLWRCLMCINLNQCYACSRHSQG